MTQSSEALNELNRRITLCLPTGPNAGKGYGSGMDTESDTISPPFHSMKRGIVERALAALLAALETRLRANTGKEGGSEMETTLGTISPSSRSIERGVVEGDVAALLAALETGEREEESMSKKLGMVNSGRRDMA